MTITNKYLVWVLVKVLRLQPYRVNFVYQKQILDEDLTTLGFLNQVKEEFNEQAELFNEEIDAEINKASKNPSQWTG